MNGKISAIKIASLNSVTSAENIPTLFVIPEGKRSACPLGKAVNFEEFDMATIRGRRFRKMAAPNDIFVGNLSSTTTEEQLREVFSVVGQIRNVRILVDKETGRLKGYAFIEYTNSDSVNAAIRLLNL